MFAFGAIVFGIILNFIKMLPVICFYVVDTFFEAFNKLWNSAGSLMNHI